MEKAAKHLSKHDVVLASIITASPLPSFIPHQNYYQELVESIISQQLSVKAASTILKRFLGLFNDKFPTPKQILDTDIEVLRSVGLSRQKATYIQDLAQKVTNGEIHFHELDTMTNDEIIATLTKIKGVGIWTVHMFLMFCMGRLDVLPTGDLGIQNGIQKLYNLTTRPDAKIIEELAVKNQWHPYKSVASWYVWHSLDNKPNL